MKKEKLKLSQLEVQSFNTSLIKGGKRRAFETENYTDQELCDDEEDELR